MADYLTFANIKTSIQRALKLKTATKSDYIDQIINQVYLNEILQCDDLHELFWLRKMDDSLNAKAPATITGITAASPGVITAVAHGLAVNDVVTVYSVVGMTEINNRSYKVNTVPSADTLTLKDLDGTALNTSGFTAYTSGGTLVHRGLTLTKSIASIENCTWHDEDVMRDIEPKELEKEFRFWDDAQNRPERFMHKKYYANDGTETNELWWWQGADQAYDLRYWYIEEATRLSNTTDVPLLPTPFHDVIISGALTRLSETGVQIEAPQVWPTLYTNGLAAIRTFNRKWYTRNEMEKREAPYML